MTLQISKVDVWAGRVEDKPGALAEKLEKVMRTGANLDFVIARPLEAQPGQSVLYVAPLVGDEQIDAGKQVGLRKSSIQVLRIEGPDRPGLSAELARTLGAAGVNISGVSAAALEQRAVIYLRFESPDDVAQAEEVLSSKLV